MTADIQQVPFVKQLAANDRPTRDNAVASLRTFLSGNRQLEELELLKLWKGLFYWTSGMWMSDRPKTQQRLAVDLAALVEVLPDSNALPFLHAFWKTMAREWNGIDVLRMDKFLLLVRAYLNASFQHLQRRNWDPAIVQEYLGILSSTPVHPTDGKIANGLRYHVIDIYVDELDKLDTPRSGEVPLLALLEPLRKLQLESPTKSVRLRVKAALADERLLDWEGGDDGGGEKDRAKQSGDEAGEHSEEDEWNGLDT
ncbi:MAG: hypothetical protein M1837_005734 [Sclerophora amabilis]|nr:MAG: hypothetical protein M1837_005734 [Sclerophora amabilis]